MIIDTHCHLHLLDDPNSAISNAKCAGLTHIVNVAVKDFDSKTYVEGISNELKIYYTVGRHPLDSFIPLSRDYILQYAGNSIAVGETGLDLFRPGPSLERQLENFTNHQEAAKLLGLPLIIHTRCAERETIESLKKIDNPFIIHCFTGTRDFAKDVLDIGGYISFSGIITYKNASLIREVVSYVPEDRILVETDSPYLTPKSFLKNFRENQPSFIIETIKCIANIRMVDPIVLQNVIAKNSIRIFSRMEF